MKTLLRGLLRLALLPFTLAWALRSPRTLDLRELRLALWGFAALGALGALMWGPMVLEILAGAHPTLRRLLPAGDIGHIYAELALSLPLLVLAALQASAARRVARRVPKEPQKTTQTQSILSTGVAPGVTLQWTLPLMALTLSLVILNLSLFALLLVCALLAGAGSVALLVAYITMRETLVEYNIHGLWEGLAKLWDFATATRHVFFYELHVLDGTLFDPMWGALLILALLYVAPTAVAVWVIRRITPSGELKP